LSAVKKGTDYKGSIAHRMSHSSLIIVKFRPMIIPGLVKGFHVTSYSLKTVFSWAGHPRPTGLFLHAGQNMDRVLGIKWDEQLKPVKPGQIYLIVDFAGGRTTWAFIINRSVPVSPKT
jgi:hypothetical protein